jgi:hypothetical protein
VQKLVDITRVNKDATLLSRPKYIGTWSKVFLWTLTGNNLSTGERISRFLWNLIGHFCTYKNPPPFPTFV